MAHPLYKLELHDSSVEPYLYKIMQSNVTDWGVTDGEWTKINAIGRVLNLLRERLGNLFVLEDSAVHDGPHIRMAQETVAKEIERWEVWQKNPGSPTPKE